MRTRTRLLAVKITRLPEATVVDQLERQPNDAGRLKIQWRCESRLDRMDRVGGGAHTRAMAHNTARLPARLIRPLACATLAIVLGGCATVKHATGTLPLDVSAQLDAADTEVAYVCPMHADVTSDSPGNCEKCGMTLVKGTPWDMRDFQLQVTTVPEVPKAGEPMKVNLRVVRPGTDEAVTDFEVVHERQYHLFVISQDMAVLQHIHPEERRMARGRSTSRCRKPGYYKMSLMLSSRRRLFAVHCPTARDGRLCRRSDDDSAQLVPEPSSEDGAMTLTATVSYDPPELRCRPLRTSRFSPDRHAGRGQPVSPICKRISARWPHTHHERGHAGLRALASVDSLPPQRGLGRDSRRSQRDFEGMMPKPGHYRAWAQFKYRDKVYTFSKTFDVAEVGNSLSR